MSEGLAKGDRVISESFGFGTILSDQVGISIDVVFDDDIAPFRSMPWWVLGKLGGDA